MSVTDITLQDIYIAHRRIAGIAKTTPLVGSSLLSERTGSNVALKVEIIQETGSFKVRGAANKLLGLTPAEQERGVIAFSTGNHGMAVAYVAQQLGIDAVICVSERVPKDRVATLERLGANVHVHGAGQDEAETYAYDLAEERRLTMVNPFDDAAVIAGQGTIGLELLEQMPQIDTALVQLSGGGLISGIALALKSANPAIRVVGISMERSPVMYHSIQAGHPVEMEEQDTLAHSLCGGIGLDNKYTFRMVQQYVDDYLLLTEDEIAAAMAFAFERQRLVVEGAGAVGIGALLAGKAISLGENVAVIVSGGNVEADVLLEITADYCLTQSRQDRKESLS